MFHCECQVAGGEGLSASLLWSVQCRCEGTCFWCKDYKGTFKKNYVHRLIIFNKHYDVRSASEQWIHGSPHCSCHPVYFFLPHIPLQKKRRCKWHNFQCAWQIFWHFFFNFIVSPFILVIQRRHWGLDKQVCHTYFVYEQYHMCISIHFYSIFQTGLNPGDTVLP